MEELRARRDKLISELRDLKDFAEQRGQELKQATERIVFISGAIGMINDIISNNGKEEKEVKKEGEVTNE